MITLAFTLLFTSCLQEPEPAAAPKLSPELTAIRTACAKLAEVPNYTFHHLMVEEGVPSGAGRTNRTPAGEGNAPAADRVSATPKASEPVEFTAHVQKNQPIHFKQGEIEAWRQENVLVWRTGNGEWQRMDGKSMRGRDRADSGTPANEEDMRGMRSHMDLFYAPAAHELVVGFESKIAMVTSSKEGAKTVYIGSLTPEGAAMLSGASRIARGGRSGEGRADSPSEGTGKDTGVRTGTGSGGPSNVDPTSTLQSSGNFRIVVDAKGQVEACTIDTVTRGTSQDRALERKRHVEYHFSAIGETKLAVPAEVTAKFADKSADKSAEKSAEKPIEGRSEF